MINCHLVVFNKYFIHFIFGIRNETVSAQQVEIEVVSQQRVADYSSTTPIVYQDWHEFVQQNRPLLLQAPITTAWMAVPQLAQPPRLVIILVSINQDFTFWMENTQLHWDLIAQVRIAVRWLVWERLVIVHPISNNIF